MVGGSLSLSLSLEKREPVGKGRVQGTLTDNSQISKNLVQLKTKVLQKF
jgi:hypothetical protein